MKNTMKMRKWIFAIVFCVVFWGVSLCAEAGGSKYNGGIVLDEDAKPVKTENGLMPSKGDVDILVIMVEFQDIKHDPAHNPDYMEQLFVGESQEQSSIQAPVSLKEYYTNSSYGQLNLSGDVVGWYTAEHERSYYGRDDLELPGVDLLFREVVTALDSQIDYSRYDSDDDGYIDGLYLVYAGAPDGWGSTFWTYVSTYVTEDLVLDNINLRKYCFYNEYESVYTLSHETGHMLGLMDYYDYDKGIFGGITAFGTNYSLMVGSVGDLDALSKVLLGWVTPQKITDKTDLSLRPINEYPDVALVYGLGEEKGRTFFLVESYSPAKNFANCITASGLRIYRVNTTLDSSGKSFLYGVTDDNEINTISIALDTANGQSKMTPYNTPSSYLLEENSAGEVQWKSTGVTIANIVIGESKTDCSVQYETISTSRKPQCTIHPIAEDNKIYLELDFDVEIKLLDEALEVSAVSEQGNIPVTLLRNNYSSKRLDGYYVYTGEQECKPDTVYTITIPAGSFQSTYGAKNEVITYSLRTADFPEVVAAERDGYDIDMDSQIIPTKDGGVVYFCVKDGYLQKVSVSGSGEKVSKPLVQLENPTYWYVRACQRESGDYIVHIFDNGEGAIYKVDAADNCKLLKSGLASGSGSQISALGKNAVLYSCYGAKYFLIKEDDTVTEGVAENPYNLGYAYLYKIWDDRYIAGCSLAEQYILDSNMNIVIRLENLRLTNLFDVIPNEQGFEIIGIESVMMGEPVSEVSSFAFDKNFNFLSKTVLPFGSIDYMKKYDGGYIIAKNHDRPFYNEGGTGIFSGVIASPIMHISFYDENKNLLFSYTVDHNGTKQGDSIENAVRLSDGRFAWATDWNVYMTQTVYQQLFADVPKDQWYYPYVKKAYDNGYMSGTGTDSQGRVIFKPLVNIPREQFVTVLYALEGVDPDSIQYSDRFTDVKASDWFAKPVEWAAQNGIVSGTGNGKFGVGQLITREQMALMLYGYARYKGYDITVNTDISSFPDAGEVSDWAKTGMSWAIQNGIMSGQKAGDKIYLKPKDSASRAVCATMIVAFAEKY